MIYELYALDFPNGKRYIGLSRRAAHRWNYEHRYRAALAKFEEYPLYRAIRKYGFDNICFSILARGTVDYITELEIKAIESFKTTDRRYGYNVALGGQLSPMLSPEVAAKVSKTKTGKRWTADQRAKLSVSLKGKCYISPEGRAAIGRKSSERMRGVPKSKETREKIRQTLLGKTLSDQHRANISAGGRGRIFSKEHRRKLSEAAKRRKCMIAGWNKGRRSVIE